MGGEWVFVPSGFAKTNRGRSNAIFQNRPVTFCFDGALASTIGALSNDMPVLGLLPSSSPHSFFVPLRSEYGLPPLSHRKPATYGGCFDRSLAGFSRCLPFRPCSFCQTLNRPGLKHPALSILATCIIQPQAWIPRNGS